MLGLVGVHGPVRTQDPEPQVPGKTHDAAHRELGDVAHPGQVSPARLHGLLAQVGVAADLVQGVQAHEVLADGGVGRGAVVLGQLHEELLGGAEHADGAGAAASSSHEVARPPLEVADHAAGGRRRGPRRAAAGTEAGPLEGEGGVGHRPALVEAADDGVVTDAGVGEEDLVEQ